MQVTEILISKLLIAQNLAKPQIARVLQQQPYPLVLNAVSRSSYD